MSPEREDAEDDDNCRKLDQYPEVELVAFSPVPNRPGIEDNDNGAEPHQCDGDFRECRDDVGGFHVKSLLETGDVA